MTSRTGTEQHEGLWGNMSINKRARRRAASALAMAAVLASGFVTTVATAAPASASARVEPCIWPDTGTNLQQYFGVTSSLVVPGACSAIPTGSTWSTPVVFYVARSWEHIPAGIVPTGATPLDELVDRLTRVRLIVDEGKPGAFTVERTIDQIHVTAADWQEVYPDDPDWLLVDIGTHITMRPLQPGQHTVRGEFEVDSPACDGTSADFEVSCIPTGVFPYPSTRTFSVVARG
jgi:uncharacterized membrane protein